MKIKLTPRQYDALYNDKDKDSVLRDATPQHRNTAAAAAVIKPKGMGNPFNLITIKP